MSYCTITSVLRTFRRMIFIFRSSCWKSWISLKKGSDQINYNAREFVRELDLITSNDLFLKGASLGAGLGTLHVVTGDKYQEKIALSFPEKTPDHRILSCTLSVAEKNPKVQTILVTKDVNLRMKARALGIQVEDYITDKVVNVDIFERAQDT